MTYWAPQADDSPPWASAPFSAQRSGLGALSSSETLQVSSPEGQGEMIRARADSFLEGCTQTELAGPRERKQLTVEYYYMLARRLFAQTKDHTCFHNSWTGGRGCVCSSPAGHTVIQVLLLQCNQHLFPKKIESKALNPNLLKISSVTIHSLKQNQSVVPSAQAAE